MDYVLDFLDDHVFDAAYAKLFPAQQSLNFSSPYAHTVSAIPRDDIYRQSASLAVITLVFAYVLYLGFASFSYYYIFDHNLMKHPKFLKDQVRKEITLSCQGVPVITALTMPWFLGEVRGYSKLYDNVSEYGYTWLLLSPLVFLFFTDMCIYFIHRWLHWPSVYKVLHKPHHKWIVPTPFASHAFHPLDGYAQSIPYHLCIYLFPMHKLLYLGMFTFVNIWTIMIHDGEYLSNDPFINGAAHHTLHHLYFNYNYGQYFTLWDRLGGSHREPSREELDKEERLDAKTFQKQILEVELKERLQEDVDGKLKAT